MELQEAPLAAPPPVRRGPGAAVAVPLPHGALHASGDVPGVYGLSPAPPRPLGGRELLPFQLPDEQPEGAVEDLVQVADGDCVAEQVLCAPQVVAGLGAGGEADLVTVGGQGSNEWPRCATGPGRSSHPEGRG